ncbi:MAG: hypothetical protein RIC55_08485 [Pirellulaceae bacterium]
MSASTKKAAASISFLTVLDQGDDGLFGGYLVLNAAGRPLEFHCTAPVKANRAQQILYGRTLAPYLYGEQIGQTLIGKAKTSPRWICTDVQPALAVRDYVATPVALVLEAPSAVHEEQEESPSSGDSTSSKTWRLDAARETAPRPHAASLLEFELGGFALAVSPTWGDDRETVKSLWREFAGLDLLEPFARIREAIEEAQKAAR